MLAKYDNNKDDQCFNNHESRENYGQEVCLVILSPIENSEHL